MQDCRTVDASIPSDSLLKPNQLKTLFSLGQLDFPRGKGGASLSGYVPPDKFVKQEEEDLSMPLNAEDEVALLLKEVQLGSCFGFCW